VRRPEETLPEHKAIIEAFAAMDAESAQSLIVLHNLRSRDALLAHPESPSS
jgi:DNA-binding GntR family transcriptional regulator